MGYQLIETVEVGSGGASSIEFTGIPQDGVDLVLLVSARFETDNNTIFGLTLNNDTTSGNYSAVQMYGTGNQRYSNTLADYLHAPSNPANTTSNTFANGQIYISNYTSTSNKSISLDSVTETNDIVALQRLIAYKYTTSSAITSMQGSPTTGNFAQYSTFSLYKITAD